MFWDVVLILLGVLLGSIPFGKIIASKSGVDISKEGSGNIGATNVFRVVGPVWGIVVLFLDAFKGSLPTYVSMVFYSSGLVKFSLPEVYVFVGVGAILGHMFSPFVGFKGGKGVATSLGVFFVLTPMGTLIALIIFGIFLVVFRIVSISSIAGAVGLFSYLVVYYTTVKGLYENYVLLLTAFFVMLLVIIKHVPNIKRLLRGEEKKIF